MNTSRLLETIQKILKVEKQFEITPILDSVNSHLNSLASNPADTSAQTQLSQSNIKLKQAIISAHSQLRPAEIERMREIDAIIILDDEIADDVTKWLSENIGTPTVARDHLNKFIAERNKYIKILGQIDSGLQQLGITILQMDEGDAEIGFMLPRDLFHNNLDGLVKELNALKRIIRAFSEAATGSVEDIEVLQISTSDPTFFFSMDKATILMIGGAITWALNTWKQVEEIRKIRAETQKVEVLKNSDIERLFDGKIEEMVKNAIDEKQKELLRDSKDGHRAREQATDISWALESIMARVERGMSVEIRLIPPKPSETETENAEEPTVDPIYEKLSAIADDLYFPQIAGTPVLAIPQLREDAPQARAAKAKAKPQ